ncbi:leucine--tRNA ligase [Blochmannia endosymbiont of Camponotus (Colobopsis) obliquus]|uniref:leucine--tRNA ligase n=1 Tax=Blochmannia endosymbiont of Camponotus (Colobopsis) obliquus TaxID=1505597 RepID=UPI00061A89DC|nr:leucine--tRNA ligase [Blochmannia endosymbiont of Camponotus (Colobopsis) obliquus]AKC60479.1 leucine--tRNA ligase [Blochmannia endosymbiont of Camponotus (Colobopsis) obliquus]
MKKFYYPKQIEQTVQQYWEKHKTFQVTEDVNKKKYYCLSMLPYPSGRLHMGHVRNYTIGDVISRYQRMLGKNVLQPMGWDAFGLPAEQAAYIHKTSASSWTYSNINYMKKQLKILGFGYDWSREITTCKPEYYLWEQWLFTILYKKKLIYKKTALVNWCPQDQTVLANEQVINGCCWRCNSYIKHKKTPQWFIKITNYAEQLLFDLDKLKYWPKKIKEMQKNWIGRSQGFEITFKITKSNQILTIYTTKIATLMATTYILISIHHPLSLKLSATCEKIAKFIKTFRAVKLTESELITTEKKGIASNINAVHPVSNQELPIWITNILTTNNETDIKMGAPNNNQQDWEFAKKYNLPINICHEINHECCNSQIEPKNKNLYKHTKQKHNKQCNHVIELNNITTSLINHGLAKYKIKYRLRDWGISRQRYWGTPIPMITLENKKVIPVPINQLPVILPENIETNNNILNPLKINKTWKNIIHNGHPAIRETDTLDTFVESSWYYARYTCPNYKKGMLHSTSANYWLPIDQYIGGIEHAVMHLIYFRFFHKLMKELGLVNSDEPAKRLLCQGMVLANAFYYLSNNNEKIWICSKNTKIKYNKKGKIIEAKDDKGNTLIHAGMIKMSKSKNNGVDPQSMIEKYGADTIRLFIMFAAPPEMPLEWNESGIQGAKRFLNRIWNLTYDHIQKGPTIKLNINNLNTQQQKLRQELHKTITKVTHDIDKRQMFNTAIASIMEFTNKLTKISKNEEQDRALTQEALEVIVRLIYPFTPHIAFVLWNALGNKKNIDATSWPCVDTQTLMQSEVNIIIQYNGKFCCTIAVPINSEKNIIQQYILHNPSLKKYLQKNKFYKTFFIKNKLLNIISK